MWVLRAAVAASACLWASSAFAGGLFEYYDIQFENSLCGDGAACSNGDVIDTDNFNKTYNGLVKGSFDLDYHGTPFGSDPAVAYVGPNIGGTTGEIDLSSTFFSGSTFIDVTSIDLVALVPGNFDVVFNDGLSVTVGSTPVRVDAGYLGYGTLVITWTNANNVGIDNIYGAVPEPATWAMMLTGFGAVGGAMRSRRKMAAVAA